MGVLSTSKEIESFKIPQEIKKSKIPIFQNSNFPKFKFSKKNQRNQKKTILHRPGGEEGVRQSPGTIGSILSVAPKSIERNKIQTK